MKSRIVYDLIVIGAGGTGTYFLKEISRFLQGRKEVLNFHIFDGDMVEDKNLSRQCFTSEDIGRNKASVMAEVLNDSFGTSFRAHPQYVLKVEQLEACLCGSAYGVKHVPLVVGCVDNHACRLVLEEFFEKCDSCILFDSGNEFSSGEVVFSYKMDKRVYGPVRSYYFPDVKKGDLRNREEISCEELNNVAPQHIFTNMLAGNILCGGVANLLDEKITPGFTYFNSMAYDMGFVPFSGKAEKTA